MKIFLSLLFISFLFISPSAYSQVAINLQKNFGGSFSDYPGFHSLISTGDGGYAIGGTTMSSDGDVTFNHGGSDYWLIKLDSNYNLQREKTYGGSLSDMMNEVIQTSDGGFALFGRSSSNNGDVTGNHGTWDYWVVKTDAIGNLQWQKSLGGSDTDIGWSIVETYDGGFAVAGESRSANGDISNPLGWEDFWIVKLSASGNMVWEKSFGGSNGDYARSIVETKDSCLLIFGPSASTDGNISGNIGQSDAWMVKTDANGTLVWEKSFGGSTSDDPFQIMKAADNGFVLTGQTWSNDYNTGGNHGGSDAWIAKIDSGGNFQWQRCSGGSMNDEFFNVYQTADHGYIAAGSISSADGDVTFNRGQYDQWVVKLDSAGNLLWQLPIGGTQADFGYDIIQNSKGKYIITGVNSSIDGDITKAGDIWIAELTDEYNEATGKMYFDLNNNSVKDVSEPVVINGKITESNSARFTYSFSDGSYDLFLVDTGQFSLIPPYTIAYFTPVPTQHSANFTALHQVDSLNDFAFQPSGVFNDLCVIITPMGNFRAGFNANYMINYENAGTTTLNGTVIFFPDNDVTFVSSNVTPTSVTTDSVVWNVGTLTPFQTGSILVTVYVNAGTPIGTLINSSVVIEPIAGDANTACNYNSWEIFVTGAVDPNAILVDRDTVLTTELTSPPYLNYIIYFQNTGNDTAFNARVLNNIPQLLDVNSFEFVASSHPMNINYGAHARLMEFTFDNILLPDSNINEPASHGFIRYRIKPLSTLVAGDLINNTVFIYFDFNAPVQTNTVVTEIVLPTGMGEAAAGSGSKQLIVYPNPANDKLIINSYLFSGKKAEMKIYDLYGREVFQLQTASCKLQTQIDVSRFSQGIYFVELQSEEQVLRGKFLKQ